MESRFSMRLATGVVAAGVVLFGAPPLTAQPGEPPTQVVQAFHAALASGDSATALSLMIEDAVVFEAGGAEMSRHEYRSHHLGADIEFSMATSREVVEQRSGVDGDVAWVLTRSATSGTFRERAIDVVGVETMILVWTEDRWKIAHIHWSSRRSPSDEP